MTLKDQSIQIRVGIFVSAGLLLAMVIIFMIGSERSWFEKKYRLVSRFEDVSGLGQGASVSLAGIRVGSVKRVGFPADLHNKQLVVEMQISREFQDRIRKDSRATIVTQGLLGDKMVMVTVGHADAPALNDGEVLETTTVGDFNSIGENAHHVLMRADHILENVDKLIADAKEGEGLVHTLLYDPIGKDLLHAVADSAHSFERLANRLEREARVAKIAGNLENASGDISQITSQIRRGEGTIGGLLSDETIYNDLRALFGHANRNVVLKAVVRSLVRANEKELRRP